MRMFGSNWLVHKATVILLLMIGALSVALIFYWNGPQESKLTSLLGGVVVGLALVIVQFMFSWDEYKERDKFRLLGLKKVLEHKKDRLYYGGLISGARTRIDLMGKTGRHFLEDFANKDGADKEARLLLEALGRNVTVRILLPKSAKSGENGKTTEQLSALAKKYANFQYRFFEHDECHSIFVADTDLVIGPFFPGVRSMDTPALHVRDDAELSKRYLDYFNEVWKNCTPKA